jgi:hypothetical protein
MDRPESPSINFGVWWEKFPRRKKTVRSFNRSENSGPESLSRGRNVAKRKVKRIYQNKMWEAARLYRKEAEKCYKARAYLMAVVARGCELEALLRIFDFVENRRPKDRCYNLNGLIDRAFKRHWCPHDALRYWKKEQHVPLKTWLHGIREARNGVHAHLFNKDVATRQTVANITFVVHAMYSFLETKNARNFMKVLHERDEISNTEYNAWKRKQKA